MLYTCDEGCQGQGCVSTGSVGGLGHSIVPTMDPNSVLVSSIVHRVSSIVHRVGSNSPCDSSSSHSYDGGGHRRWHSDRGTRCGRDGCAGKPGGEIAVQVYGDIS